MEFKKVNKSLYDIIVDNKEVGKIDVDRCSGTGTIRGYEVRFNIKIAGYRFREFEKNLKNAKNIAEKTYNRMLKIIKNFVYDEELNMYFRDEQLRIKFRNTEEAKTILRSR